MDSTKPDPVIIVDQMNRLFGSTLLCALVINVLQYCRINIIIHLYPALVPVALHRYEHYQVLIDSPTSQNKQLVPPFTKT